MNRHRNGQFRERPASEARPMTTYAPKCARVSNGNRTRAAKARALIMQTAAKLRDEARAAHWAKSTLGILEAHGNGGAR